MSEAENPQTTGWGDLWDFLSGLAGLTVFMLIYSQSPQMALGFVGFHIGVVSMRMSRGWTKKESARAKAT